MPKMGSDLHAKMNLNLTISAPAATSSPIDRPSAPSYHVTRHPSFVSHFHPVLLCSPFPPSSLDYSALTTSKLILQCLENAGGKIFQEYNFFQFSKFFCTDCIKVN